LLNSDSNIVLHRFESKILKPNSLKDPYIRDIIVYLPPGYSQTDSKGYVAVLALAGFGGTGRMLLNADPFGENIEQRMNRLILSKKCGPMILVLPDCFTKFGGNQYVNSTATGMYEDYIVNEIIPFIERKYNICANAVFRKSSGGYGSMLLGMRHPNIFQAIANHSGDSAFEYCYLPDFPKALEAFKLAGSPRKWLEDFWTKPNRHLKKDSAPLNILAMAAHYSPNPLSEHMGVDLPFDLETGEILEHVWSRWQLHDPTRLVEKYAENLKKLKLIFIDCGIKDEFNIQWGSRILHSKLLKMKIDHCYEEFNDGHMNINYRYDVSLPKIYDALG